MLKWARILIIQDELLVAWSLRDVLSLIGCEVTGIVATVSEALILAENTKPDLADNLKKLVNDAMSGIVYKDDGLIVSEDNVKKYYGTGGAIIIELQGKWKHL